MFAASTGLSAALASVAVWLVMHAGVPPNYVWLVFAGLALLSAWVCSLSAVSLKEYHEKASEVIGYPSKPQRASIVKQAVEVMKWWKKYPVSTALFVLFSIFAYCSIGIWSAVFMSVNPFLLLLLSLFLSLPSCLLFGPFVFCGHFPVRSRTGRNLQRVIGLAPAAVLCCYC